MRQELHPTPQAASRTLARNTHHHTGPSGLRTSASMAFTGTPAGSVEGVESSMAAIVERLAKDYLPLRQRQPKRHDISRMHAARQ